MDSVVEGDANRMKRSLLLWGDPMNQPLTTNAAIGILLATFAGLTLAFAQQATDTTLKEVMQVQARHEAELFKIPGVRGVGIGKEDGRFILEVFANDQADLQKIPKDIEGVMVKVTTSGDFYAMSPTEPIQLKGVLLVVNKSDNALSFIDVTSKEVVGSATTGEGPHELVVSPDGKYAYVSNYGVSGKPGNTISLVDVAQKKEIDKIDLGDFKRPHGIKISKDGKHLYVTCEANKALVVIDTETKKVARSIKTNQDVSHMVALSPDETRAYITNMGSDTVTVIDLKKNALVTNIPVSKVPEGIDLSPDGKTLYVANRSANSMSVIDTAANKVIKTVPTGVFPIRISAPKGDRFVLVSNAHSGNISVFETFEYKEVARIRISGKMPIGLLVDPSGKRFYVANSGSNAISIVEMGSWKVVGEITTGNEPDGLGYVLK